MTPVHALLLLAFLKLLNQLLGRGDAIAVLDQIGDEAPIQFDVQPDADPAVMPDVGRHEEALRLGAGDDFLKALWRFHPQRGAVVHRVAHGENLVAHHERRAADAAFMFDGFGQRQANRAQTF